MKKIYKVIEYSTIDIDYTLNQQERNYMQALSLFENGSSNNSRFEYFEGNGILQLKTKSWVGIIELDSIRIEIRPKFNEGFSALIDMICFINNLPYYLWHDTKTEYYRDDLIELLVRLYIKELDKLMRHGLFKEYVIEEENLRQLRGRPVITQHLRKNRVSPTRIFCNFDELLTDVTENQVILSALEIAFRFQLHDFTKRQVNMYRCEFEKACSSYTGTEWPDFYYHRLNAHYETAHLLSSFIIKHTAVSEIYKYQKQSFFSILVDMNNLFEQFLGELLRRYLPSYYLVKAGTRLSNAIMLNSRTYRQIIPDLLIKNQQNNQIVVIDTKYKPYAKRHVDNSDLYQLAFYAQYYKREFNGGHSSTIVYPIYADDNEEKHFSIDLLPGTYYHGTVHVKGISIEETLEAEKEKHNELLQEKALFFVVT